MPASTRYGRLLAQMSEWAAAALRVVPLATASAGVALLVLLQIPFMDSLLDAVNLNDSESIRTTTILVILAAISGQLYELSSDRRTPADNPRRYFNDPIEVYPVVAEMTERVTPANRSMDILGVTLGGILPVLLPWLRRPESTEATVRVAAMSALVNGPHAFVNPARAEEAISNVGLLRTVAASEDVRRRGIVVEIYEYDFPPAFYGVRFGNGDLLISFLRWSDQRVIDLTGAGLEFVPHSEHTPSANNLRHLFDSWFRRAMATVPQTKLSASGQA